MPDAIEPDTVTAAFDLAPTGLSPAQPVSLVDVLDRVLGRGAVVAGDLVISVADIDLVRISLRALLASVGAAAVAAGGAPR